MSSDDPDNPHEYLVFVSWRVDASRPCAPGSERDAVQTYFDSRLSTAQRRWAFANAKVSAESDHRHPSEVFTYKKRADAEAAVQGLKDALAEDVSRGDSKGRVVLVTEADYVEWKRRQQAKDTETIEATATATTNDDDDSDGDNSDGSKTKPTDSDGDSDQDDDE